MPEKPTYEELEQRVRELEKADVERRQADKALRETSLLLEGILDAVPDIIGIQKPDHTIIRYNKAGYEALNLPHEKIVGKRCFELLGKPLICEKCATASALKSKKLETVEQFFPELGRYYLCRSNPVLDDTGEVSLIIEQLHDITERKQAEEALQASEQRMRTIVDNSPMSQFVIDKRHRIIHWNQALEKYSGIKAKDVIGTTQQWRAFYDHERPCLADLLLDGEVDRIRELYAGKYRPSGLIEGAFEVTDFFPDMRGGTWLFFTAALIQDADANVIGAIETLIDITDRKQAEEALRESERRFQRMLGVVPDMISIHSPEMDIIYSNWQGFAAVPEAKQIPNTKCYKTYRGLDNICQDCQAGSVLESRKPIQKEVLLPDGTWVDLRAIPVLDQENNVEMFMEWVRDITEHKQAEEALRTSEERYRRIAENMSDVVFIADFDLKTTYVSPSIERLVGESVAEHLKRRMEDKFPPESLDKIYTVFAEEIEREKNPDCDKKRSRMVEVEHFRPDGSTIWISVNLSFVRDENGNPVAIQGVARDITYRKRAEEEREKLQEQLSQSQKMEAIGSLAGGVAHDLNNLLSPILGYGEMLRDDLDPEDIRRDSMDEIISAGLRARDLVRQLLAFSRKQILEFKPVNLNKVAAGLEKLLQRTIREDIQMEFDLTPDAGVVMADIGQIEQVIMNLSVNAADAMPEGGKLTVETSKAYLDEEYANHHTSVKPGEYVMLAVSDSGAGMDEATREKIFDPFFSTKGESGTGLGLATVYGIVKQHGGNIWVYSEPGKGSTFKVYLPVVETSEPEETTSVETIEDLKGSETILIVEDSDQVRRLAESVLKRNGYQVLTAKDGAEALEAMASHDRPVNLLLTDVVLPGMNGRELYEKAAESYPSMKVLYMSGYTDNVIAHRGVLDEGVQFIQKPFTVYGLAVKVREVLDEQPRK